MFKKIVMSVVVFCLTVGFASADVLGEWGLSSDGQPTSTAANVTAREFTGGSGIGSITFGSSGAYVNGWSTGAIDLTKYFQIVIKPNNGYNLNITDVNFGERRSSTGISDYEVRWSDDNFSTFSTIAAVNVPDNDSERIGDITGLNININDGDSLIIRWYGFNAEASTGTWRINDGTLSIEGTVTGSGGAETTPHTITIDGSTEEWYSSERFTDVSSADSFFCTWDADYIYAGIKGAEADYHRLATFIYVDTDPAKSGSSDAYAWGENIITPFDADYVIVFKNEVGNDYIELREYNNATSSWGQVVSETSANYNSGELQFYVGVDGREFKIKRTLLGSPTDISICSFTEQQWSPYWRYFAWPNNNWSDANRTSGQELTHYYKYDLTQSVEPNDNTFLYPKAVTSVIISEIAGKGYDGDYNDEYIELYNSSESSVDLTGWTLEYYESSLEYTANLTGSIEAKSTYVIAVRSGFNIPGITPDLAGPGSGWSLNNDCYAILKDGSKAIADQAGDSSDKFTDDHNYSLDDYSVDNYPVSNWTDLNTDNGTPGVANDYIPVMISEIAGKGYDSDYNNEYIELYNNSGSSVDLTGWTLEYYESSLEYTANLSGSIAANSTYLIAVRSGFNITGITPDLAGPGSGWSLNNDCYAILKNGTKSIVDQAGDSSDKFTDDHNYSLDDYSLDNYPVSNWTDLNAANGTPGQPNDAGDVISPTIMDARASSETTVEISFSEKLDAATAEEETNYTVDNGLSVTNASLTDSIVTLTTTSQTPETAYTVTINNVEDLSGNPISADSEVGFTGYVEVSGATDLFISEYIEGSGNNKAVEIFNGTGSDVDLSNYEIWIIFNGGSWSESQISLSGTLANGDVYVVYNSSADAGVSGVGDLSSGSASWSGDDAVGLAKNTGKAFELIDAVGTDGADPGSGWDAAGTSNATAEHTLIRKSSIYSPNTDWTSSAGTDASDSEWIVQSQDYFDNLGSHDYTSPAPTTKLQFVSGSGSISEDGGTYNIDVSIINPDGSAATECDVALISGSAADINNYTTQSLSFPAGSSDNQTVTVTITDDDLMEGAEDFVFEIQSISGGNSAEAGATTQFTLTINDNDMPDIIINEIMADPTGLDTNGDGTDDYSQDEFVEIYNNDSEIYDLSGWKIHDSSGLRHVFPENSILIPGAAVVVFGGGTPTGDFGNSLVQIASEGSLGLNNSGDDVILKNQNGDNITDYTYGGEAGDDQSITRVPDITGSFEKHTTAAGSGGAAYSPGTKIDGSKFHTGTIVRNDISTPAVWTAASSPYIIAPILGNSIGVENSDTLKIEDGVEIQFADTAGIYLSLIEGFKVLGTEINPVVIKNHPAFNGYWHGIIIEAVDESDIRYLNIEKAGHENASAKTAFQAVLTFSDNWYSNHELRHVNICDFKKSALLLQNNDVTIVIDSMKIEKMYGNQAVISVDNSRFLGERLMVLGNTNNSTGALSGVLVNSSSGDVDFTLKKSTVENCFVDFTGAENQTVVLENNIFSDYNEVSNYAVRFDNTIAADSEILIKNNTFDNKKNLKVDFSLSKSNDLLIKNNIFWNQYDSQLSGIDGTAAVIGVVKYNCLNTTGFDITNIPYNPQLDSDYTLLSGSPCIDNGDPADSYINEPEENGSRINIGAFGNTENAAQTGFDYPNWIGMWPGSHQQIDSGSSITVYGKVNEPGVTNTPGEGIGIDVEIGYGQPGTQPWNGAWTWEKAEYDSDIDGGANDQYMAILNPPNGVSAYAVRFRKSGNMWSYLNQTNNGGPVLTDGTEANGQALYDSDNEIKLFVGNYIVNNIASDRTLESGKTYIIPHRIDVEEGVVLTIESGAALEFAAANKTTGDFDEADGKTDVGFLVVKGALRIDTSKKLQLTNFTKESAAGPNDYWGGIIFYTQDVSAAPGAFNSLLKYANVQYANKITSWNDSGKSVDAEGAVFCYSAVDTVSIENSGFENNNNTGLTVKGGNVKVSVSDFSNNNTGIDMTMNSDDNSVLLDGCTFNSNIEVGLFVRASAETELRNSSFASNPKSIWTQNNSDLHILNTIIHNSNKGIYAQSNFDADGLLMYSNSMDVSLLDAASCNIDRATIYAHNNGVQITSSETSHFSNSILWHELGYNPIPTFKITAEYCCINGDYKGVYPGTGNISSAPIFNDLDSYDFTVHTLSPTIDKGNPSANYSNEPEPNGNRLNMGFYGNTANAAVSTPVAVFADISSNTLDFGEVEGGTAKTLPLKIENNGYGNLVIDNFTNSETEFFSLNSYRPLLSLVIPSGETDSIRVRFSPKEGIDSTYNDVVNVDLESGLTDLTVDLTGDGIRSGFDISGTIDGTNNHWTIENQPYIVTGDIIVPNGVTLTIDPGVSVLFDGHYQIAVQGRVLAEGEESDSIHFTVRDTTGFTNTSNTLGGWKGIRYTSNSTPDSSKFTYCVFEYGKLINHKNMKDDETSAVLYSEDYSNIKVEHSVFRNNFSYEFGGAVHLFNSNIVIKNSEFHDNIAGYGGGLYLNSHSDAQLLNINVHNNKSKNGYGGGLYCVNSDFVLKNSIVNRNTNPTGSGGGMYIVGCDMLIKDSEFKYNSSEDQGGGIFIMQSYHGKIENCTIGHNQTTYNDEDGGGIALILSSLEIKNTLINSNMTNGSGGAAAFSYDDGTNFTNCTITSNHSMESGGALYFDSNSDPSFKNCIIYGSHDSKAAGDEILIGDNDSDPNFYYCDIKGGTADFVLLNGAVYNGDFENNIDIDPIFISPPSFNYHLTETTSDNDFGSPCIDAGDPSSDYSNEPADNGSRINMGIYGNTSEAASTNLYFVGWANLQFPEETVSAVIDQEIDFYGQVYEDGITNAKGQGFGIDVEFGYGPAGSNPWSGFWNWEKANFNIDVGNNDEYKATVAFDSEGVYAVAFRYRKYGNYWAYTNTKAGKAFTDGSSANGQAGYQDEFNVTVGNYLVDDITSDKTLFSGQEYIIMNRINIETGVTLTIEPGAVLKFKSSDVENDFIENNGTANVGYFVVKGNIEAGAVKDCKDNEIIFTKDNPLAGYHWGGILFYTQPHAESQNSLLNNVRFEYMRSVVNLNTEAKEIILTNGVQMYSAVDSVIINNSTFENNLSNGITIAGGKTRISNSDFILNDRGIYMNMNSDVNSVIVDNCSFIDNTTGLSINGDAETELKYCIFDDNIKGIETKSSSNINIVNTKIFDNNYGIYAQGDLDAEGLLMYSNSTDISIMSSAVCKIDKATIYAHNNGVQITSSETSYFSNSILWHESDFNPIPISNITAEYCCINGDYKGVYPGIGNINTEPFFNNSGAYDFTINPTSHTVDKGDPSDDYNNEPEPNGNRLNMGYYGNSTEAAVSTPDYEIYTLVNDTLDFGNILAGDKDTLTVTIENTGNGNLVLKDAETTVPQFIVEKNQKFTEHNLAPNEILELRVIFAPTLNIDNEYTGNIELTGETSEQDTTIALKGNGVWEEQETYPKPRAYHSQTIIGDDIYTFGGIDNNSTLLNDLWIFETDNNSYEKVLTNPLNKPSPRKKSILVNNGTDLFLIGGEDNSKTGLKDIWKFDIGNVSWSELILNTPLPYSFSNAKAEYIDGKIYLFGGTEVSSVYEIDPSTGHWYEKDDLGRRLTGHQTYVRNSNIYVWGGYDHTNNTYNHRLFKYNKLSDVWTQITTFDTPEGRKDFAGTLINGDRFLITGGQAASGTKSDSWILDINNYNWTQVQECLNVFGTDLVYSASNDYAYLFAGKDTGCYDQWRRYRFDFNMWWWFDTSDDRWEYQGIPEIVINELYYDSDNKDSGCYTELKGIPGLPLTGIELSGLNGSNNTVYNVIDLSDHSISGTGYFVIAQDGSVANTDLIDAKANWQNGADAVRLILNSTTLDAVQYGNFNPVAGEGNPAPDVSAGKLLARIPDGIDTDDNAADFKVTVNKTPGVKNSLVPPTLAADPNNLDFGITAVGSSANLNIELTNTGEEEMNIVSYSFAPDSPFRLTVKKNKETISPNEDIVKTIVFNPTEYVDKDYEDTLEIISNSPDSPHKIPLKGSGRIIIPPDFTILNGPSYVITKKNNSGETITASIKKIGLTDSNGNQGDITAQFGYGGYETNPSAGGWIWSNAVFHSYNGEFYDYSASVPAIVNQGEYSYTFRFSLDNGNTYTYADVIGVSGNNPPNTSELGHLIVYLDIKDIQGESASSPYDGQEVFTKGTVFAVANESKTAEYFIQDFSLDAETGWNGIAIYNHSGISYLPVEGDEILIKGEVDEYNGLTELKNLDYIDILNTSKNLPQPLLLSTDNANQEKYESCYIQVRAAVCNNTDLGYGEWQVNDGSGDFIADDLIYSFTPTLNTPYTITGVLYYSYGDYKIEPRSAADVFESGTVIYDISEDIESPKMNEDVKVSFKLNNPEIEDDDIIKEFEYEVAGTVYNSTVYTDAKNNSFYSFIDHNNYETAEDVIEYTIRAIEDVSNGLTDEASRNIKTSALSSDIIINEVMHSPTAGVEGEWIEIYNKADYDINVIDWKLAANGGIYDFSSKKGEVLIPSKEYFVLGRNNNTIHNGNYNPDLTYGPAFELQDSDHIKLIKGLDEIMSELIIDSNYPNQTGSSIALVKLDSDYSLSQNWFLSNITYGNGDLGTPGAKNFYDYDLSVNEILINDDEIAKGMTIEYGVKKIIIKIKNCGAAQNYTAPFSINIVKTGKGVVYSFTEDVLISGGLNSIIEHEFDEFFVAFEGEYSVTAENLFSSDENGGNDENDGNITVEADNIIPGVPRNLQLSNVGDGESIRAQWDFPALNPDHTAGYILYYNNGVSNIPVDVGYNQSFVINDLEANQTISVTVKAYNFSELDGDLSGSESIEVLTAPEPEPASNLTAEDTPDDNGKSITLTWTKSPSEDNVIFTDFPIVFYNVYRARSFDGIYSKIGESAAAAKDDVRIYIDYSALSGVEYFYYVTASTGFTESDASNKDGAEAVPNIPPQAPLNISAEDTQNDLGYHITVSWEDSPEIDRVTYYNLYRKDNEEWSLINEEISPTINSIIDAVSENELEYSYRLTSVQIFKDQVLESEPSNTAAAEAYIDIDAPLPPANLSVEDKPADNGYYLNLRWDLSPSDQNGVEFYRVYLLLDGTWTNIENIDAHINNYSVRVIENNTEYFFKVSAVGYSGFESDFSNTASGIAEDNVVPRPPTNVRAADTPNDNGLSITLTWNLSQDDSTVKSRVQKYDLKDVIKYYIFRKNEYSDEYICIDSVDAGISYYEDTSINETDIGETRYWYALKSSDNTYLSGYSNLTSAIPYDNLSQPEPPSNVTGEDWPNDQGGKIYISWNLSEDEPENISGYKIYRKEESDEYYQNEIAAVNKGIYAYSDVDEVLEPGKFYHYIVKAYNGNSESEPSNEILVRNIDNIPPSPPRGLTALDNPNDQGGAIILNWMPSINDDNALVTKTKRKSASDNYDVERYKIFRKKTHSGTYMLLAETEAGITQYIDNECDNAAPYYYKIQAYDHMNSSNSSNTANARAVDNIAPNAPENLIAELGEYGKISINWELSTDDGSGINDVQGYKVLRSIDFDSGYKIVSILEPGVSEYEDYFEGEIASLYYKVIAFDSNNNSDFSNTASVDFEIIEPDTTPPADIEGLTVINNTNKVRLSWILSPDDPYNYGEGISNDVKKYIIRKVMDSEEEEFYVPRGISVFSDNNVIIGEEYTYTVIAFDGVNESENPLSISVSVVGYKPEPPTNVRYLINDDNLILRWTLSEDEETENISKYEVFFAELDESFGAAEDAVDAGIGFWIKELVETGDYKAGVCAVDIHGLRSDTVSVNFSYTGKLKVSNYPNPFNPKTTIHYNLPESGNVEIIVYNVDGQIIKRLVNEYQNSGIKNIVWNGCDENGNQVASGMYFYRIKYLDKEIINNMILLK